MKERKVYEVVRIEKTDGTVSYMGDSENEQGAELLMNSLMEIDEDINFHIWRIQVITILQ